MGIKLNYDSSQNRHIFTSAKLERQKEWKGSSFLRVPELLDTYIPHAKSSV